MSDLKICSVCGKEKSLDEFYSQKKYSKMRGDYIYYNPECKECTKNRYYMWIENNPEQYEKNWKDQIENPSPKRVKYLRNHGKEQRESGYYKKWQQNNPDKISKYNTFRAMNKTHDITEQQWKFCKEYFEFKCAYCGISEAESVEKYGQKFHREHVYHYGSNEIDNCVPACKGCNSNKWQHEFLDWYSPDNERFDEERLNKILQWLESEYEICL